MTDPDPGRPEPDILPPEPGGALSVPPPVPQKKPGFLRRLFMSRRKQQAVAMQNGYLEMVDLIRAIRSHLDRQEGVQTSVLAMLEKVPGAMDRQHEVMTMFKQHLENGMENNRRLTDSMGNLNNTLASMDESQRASAHTVTDLIHRSRESEQLLREVMRRAERRMTLLLVVFFLLVIGMVVYVVRWQNRAEKAPAAATVAAPAVVETKADKPAAAEFFTVETAKEKKAGEAVPAPGKKVAETAPIPPKEEKATAVVPVPMTKEKAKGKRNKAKTEPPPADKPEAKATDETPVGQPDLTLDQIKQAVGEAIQDAQTLPPPSDKPVSMP